MQLDSYTSELCLLQREESLRHLFLKCAFARNCWNQIGVMVPTWLKPERATRHLKRLLGVPFAMEIIVILCWCIWKEQNSWIFNNEDPPVERCKATFKREFAMVIHRSKERLVPEMQAWLQSLA
jgi:hypothetical protein